MRLLFYSSRELLLIQATRLLGNISPEHRLLVLVWFYCASSSLLSWDSTRFGPAQKQCLVAATRFTSSSFPSQTLLFSALFSFQEENNTLDLCISELVSLWRTERRSYDNNHLLQCPTTKSSRGKSTTTEAQARAQSARARPRTASGRPSWDMKPAQFDLARSGLLFLCWYKRCSWPGKALIWPKSGPERVRGGLEWLKSLLGPARH